MLTGIITTYVLIGAVIAIGGAMKITLKDQQSNNDFGVKVVLMLPLAVAWPLMLLGAVMSGMEDLNKGIDEA